MASNVFVVVSDDLLFFPEESSRGEEQTGLLADTAGEERTSDAGGDAESENGNTFLCWKRLQEPIKCPRWLVWVSASCISAR